MNEFNQLVDDEEWNAFLDQQDATAIAAIDVDIEWQEEILDLLDQPC